VPDLYLSHPAVILHPVFEQEVMPIVIMTDNVNSMVILFFIIIILKMIE
jgi:hypothetical protein